MGFLFALPAAIYMMVFIGYPMIQNLILSFKNVDVYSFAQPDNQVFVGLQNYIELFTSGNSILTKSIANTLIFTVGSIFFQFIIGFALALLFNKKFAGCSFFRGMTMISWLLPVTVAGLLFKFMFASSGGIINQFLVSLHIIDSGSFTNDCQIFLTNICCPGTDHLLNHQIVHHCSKFFQQGFPDCKHTLVRSIFLCKAFLL